MNYPFVTAVIGNYQISATDSILEVDTSLGSFVLTLPSSFGFNDVQAKRGYSNGSFGGFTIVDKAGMASTNPIVIQANPDDKISLNLPSVTINQNFGGATFNIAGNNIWGVAMFGLGGASTLNYPKTLDAIISQTGQNAPVYVDINNSASVPFVDTIGGVWSYANQGMFNYTKVGAFANASKVNVKVYDNRFNQGQSVLVGALIISNDVIQFQSVVQAVYNGATPKTNGVIYAQPIKIEIWS